MARKPKAPVVVPGADTMYQGNADQVCNSSFRGSRRENPESCKSVLKRRMSAFAVF